jgi:hypothetical protein
MALLFSADIDLSPFALCVPMIDGATWLPS